MVMDEDTCMVDVARYFLNFTQLESCGKCIQCRWGTKQMLDILEGIVSGDGREGDIELLLELGEAVRDGSLCALGGTAPNPVLTTIRYFRDEYEAHINEKCCPALSCKALVDYLSMPKYAGAAAAVLVSARLKRSKAAGEWCTLLTRANVPNAGHASVSAEPGSRQ